jgi:outer membrane protein assembly factor BamB
MKKNRNGLYLLLFLLIGSGCSTTKNTFDTVYEKKTGVKPNYFISYNDEGTAVFGIQGKKSNDEIIPYKAFYVSGDGNTLWNSKISRLGKIQKDPNFKVIWDEGVALFFSRTLFKFNLSCVELSTQKELWSRVESNPGQYSYSAAYIPTEKGILHYTPNGLEMIDIKTGETRWTREDLLEKINFEDFVTGNNNSGYFFSEKMNKILISKDNHLYALNPETGEYDWKIEQPIGTVFNADIFEEEAVAFFYGVEDKSLAESIVRSNDARIDQVMSVFESGLVDKELYFVDLEKGKVLWDTKYKSNGDDLHYLLNDKIIIANIITYAFDRNTGEVLWQSVSQEDLGKQDVLKVLKATNLIDLTVGDASKPSDVLKEGAVYNIYPKFFESPLKRKSITLRKYNVNTGEVIWETGEEKLVPSYFYQEKDQVYLVAGNIIYASNLLVYDEQTGEKRYGVKFSDVIRDIVPTDNYLYVTYGSGVSMMRVLDRKTGEDVEMNLAYGPPSTIRDVGNYIMAAYDKNRFKDQDKIAFHKKTNWEVVRELDVPEYFNGFTYKGGNLFLTDFDNRERGVIDIDLENMTVHDYLITRTSGSYTVNGQDQLLGDYHLFITPDGNYIYETNGKKVRKLAID